MKPTLERLTEQFTQLIGPEAFAKAAAARASAEAAAKAAAEAAAAKAAAAKAAAAAAAAAAPAAAATPRPVPAVSAAAPAAAPGAAAPRPVTPVAPRPAAAPAPGAPAVAAAPLPASAAAAGAAAPAPAARPAVPAAAAARPAAPAPAPVAPVIPPMPVETVDPAAKGYNFDAIVAPAQVVEAARLMDAQGFGLDTITGVDWIAQNEMEVVYDYFHPTEPVRAVVRTRVPRANPELPSISAVFGGANWHERETHDFFGIRFTGHPNLKPFLLPEDADFHPLRKDFQS